MNNKRIRKKRLQEFIDSIAVVKMVKMVKMEGVDDVPESYVSRVDGSYLTFVGSEDTLKFLLKRGITDQVTHGLGFNPLGQKWYGWSHRAIFGFSIGSKCKQDSAGHSPDNKDSFLSKIKRVNKSINPNHKFEYWVDERGVSIKSTFLGDPDDKSQDKFIRSSNTELSEYPEKWGRGEWTATTIEEAKEMANDFRKSVS